MRKTVVSGLIGLNLLLLIALWSRVGGENAAIAQARRPSNYIMIPGDVSGGSSAVVYMIDTDAGLLGAMAYDDARHELGAMPPIDLARVFEGNASTRGTRRDRDR